MLDDLGHLFRLCNALGTYLMLLKYIFWQLPIAKKLVLSSWFCTNLKKCSWASKCHVIISCLVKGRQVIKQLGTMVDIIINMLWSSKLILTEIEKDKCHILFPNSKFDKVLKHVFSITILFFIGLDDDLLIHKSCIGYLIHHVGCSKIEE